MKKSWLFTAVCLLSLVCVSNISAQGWSEPVIDGSLRSGPLTPPPVTGTTFYVDKNSLGGTCNDSNTGTTLATPWCTIGKAVSTLTAGQQVLVRTGTYNEGDFLSHSGSAGNYITFRAYTGEVPVLNCSGHTWCLDGYDTGAASYVVWNGFELLNPIQEFLSCLLTSGCHHIWFINGKYHDNGINSAGFRFDSTNNVFSNNEIYNSATAPLLMGAGGGFNNIAEFNIVHDNGRASDDEGGFKCGGQGYNCILRYNTVYNNWRDPAALWCFSPGNCKGISGLYIDTGADTANGGTSYIYNNTVHDNDIGIEVFNSSGVRVFNNVVYHNGFTPGQYTGNPTYGDGMTLQGFTAQDLQVYSNTVYNNQNIGVQFGPTPTAGITTRNNIMMNNGNYEIESNGGGSNGNFDYDLIADSSGVTLIRWNNTNYSSLANFLARGGNTTWTHAVGTNATFVDVAANNYHLTSTSAGKDAGATVALFSYDRDNVSRPQGSFWDIGAYEFVAAGPQAPTNLHIIP